MPTRTSAAAQDYLKTMFMLERESRGSPIATTAIAHRLSVSAASATNMLKKLSAMGLVIHAPYRGAELTDSGRRIALEVIRHHRLLETYLAEALGVPWDEVHAEAEILEHVLSEDLEDRIAALLGNPTADPHGHPIPAKDGHMPPTSEQRLWDVADGERVAVDRVSDQHPEALRYLADIGVVPGAQLEVVRRGPVSGPLFVRIDESKELAALSMDLAKEVWVA